MQTKIIQMLKSIGVQNYAYRAGRQYQERADIADRFVRNKWAVEVEQELPEFPDVFQEPDMEKQTTTQTATLTVPRTAAAPALTVSDPVVAETRKARGRSPKRSNAQVQPDNSSRD